MTSKVEELRHKLHVDVTKDIEGVASAWGDSEYITERKIQGFRSDLDSLISAAHAEGAVEGAEQERKREIQVTCGVCGHTWKGVLAPPVQTEKEHEIQFLRADLAAIDRLLAGLPVGHVIERLGFESKKQEEEERLAVLAPTKEVTG